MKGMDLTVDYHDAGVIFGSALYDLFSMLVSKFGFEPNWKSVHSKPPKGNIIFLKLAVSALSLQPCNPTLLHSRDALLVSEQNLFEGRLKCYVWAAFARRGMGELAHDGGGFEDDFTMPSLCKKQTS
jgi:extracellular elastinolytic metalloproteinase